MGLRELRSLATVADLGSITRTAEKLNLTPPAIHKQLRCLQTELGVQLYEKVGRRLQLTPAAEIVLPYLRELLANYDAAIEALNEWKGVKKGLVRIGTGPTMSSYILPSLLKEFRRKFPAVDLFVETGNTLALLENLGKGLLDLTLIVSSGLPEEPAFSVQMEWPFEIVFVSSPQKVPKKCMVSDLSRFPFILFKKGSRVGNLIDRYFAEVRFHPRVVMRFDNPEAIKAMMRTGLGISMLAMWTVGADLRKGSLQLIHQREHPLISKIALVVRKSRYVSPAVAEFIELARNFKWKSPWLTKR